MAVVTAEIEFTSSVPASKLYKAFSDFDNIGPKAEPETYKSIETVQGDGAGVGTIKSITYADGYPVKNLKNKIDVNDKTNLCIGYTVFEGDALMGVIETATHVIKFIPSSNGGSVYKHTMEFKCKGDFKLGEDQINIVKQGCGKTFKAIESYVNAHPEAY